MRKHHLMTFFGILTLISTFSSCSESLDVKAFSYAVGTVTKDSADNYSLTLDNNKKLLLSDSIVINFHNIKEQDRIFASFYILDEFAEGYDYIIQVSDLYKIQIKPVIKFTSDNADSIGHDRSEITRTWLHKDLLNIEFKIKGTGAVVHDINLVSTEFSETTQSGYTLLEFRHNLNGDSERNLYHGIISFQLGKFASPSTEAKGFIIRYKSFQDGEKEIKVNFRDKQEENVERINRKPAGFDYSYN